MDQGWSWVVLGASMLGFFVVAIQRYVVGVMHAELLHKFQASNTATAWVGALYMTVMEMGGLVASGVVERYGCRVCWIVGGLLCFFGYASSALTTSIMQLFFTYGLVAGLGSAFVYVPTVICVGYYFKRLLALASGLASAAAAIGLLCGPLLIQNLINEYRISGGFLLLGAISLHHCVSGMLFRPTTLDLPTETRTSFEVSAASETKDDDTGCVSSPLLEPSSADMEKGESLTVVPDGTGDIFGGQEADMEQKRNRVVRSEKGSETSEKGSETSGKGSGNSGKGSETSGKGSETSGKGSGNSGKGSGNSGKGSEHSGKGSRIKIDSVRLVQHLEDSEDRLDDCGNKDDASKEQNVNQNQGSGKDIEIESDCLCSFPHQEDTDNKSDDCETVNDQLGPKRLNQPDNVISIEETNDQRVPSCVSQSDSVKEATDYAADSEELHTPFISTEDVVNSPKRSANSPKRSANSPKRSANSPKNSHSKKTPDSEPRTDVSKNSQTASLHSPNARSAQSSSAFQRLTRNYRVVLTNRAFLLHCAGRVANCMHQAGAYLHLPEYAQTLGTSPNMAAQLFIAAGCGSLVARLAMGVMTNDSAIDALVVNIGLAGLCGLVTILFPLYAGDGGGGVDGGRKGWVEG
ncbi:hypothetical protein ACOMHN_024289 [Nucella lapillus]